MAKNPMTPTHHRGMPCVPMGGIVLGSVGHVPMGIHSPLSSCAFQCSYSDRHAGRNERKQDSCRAQY